MDLVDLIKEFEDRNNFRIVVKLYGTGTANVMEFGTVNIIRNLPSYKHLLQFLKTTNYEKTKDGMKLLKPKNITNDK